MILDATWLQRSFPNLAAFTPLATGGQKCVYKVVETATTADRVLKIFRPGGSSSEAAMREALAPGKIAAPRVPQILSSGSAASNVGDLFWLLEEHLDGETLEKRLTRGPLNSKDVLRLAFQILESLAVAEEKRVVHRDVKPANIMVRPSGDFWLLDFGVARHLDLVSLTPTAAPFGSFTPGYAPPEQFNNRKREIDSRADLFALGVTLVEAATGRIHSGTFRKTSLQFCASRTHAPCSFVAQPQKKCGVSRLSGGNVPNPKGPPTADRQNCPRLDSADLRRGEVRGRKWNLYLQFGHNMRPVCLELIGHWGGGTVVLSPRDQTPDQLTRVAQEIHAKPGGRVLLDPQWYFPRAGSRKIIIARFLAPWI